MNVNSVPVILDLELASLHNFTVELIYKGASYPSWITVSTLKSEHKVEGDRITNQLTAHPGIAKHSVKGVETTYRLCPGIDGFTVAKMLTDALEAIESGRVSVCKVMEYGNQPCHHDLVPSFDSEAVIASLKLLPEDFV